MLISQWRLVGTLLLFGAALAWSAEPNDAAKTIRVGIIGLDTSHVMAFTKIFNDPKASGDLAGIKVVAGFPGGSPDIPASRDRVGNYTRDLKAMGVEIVDSIPALLDKVDVVLLESVDGRPHVAQVRPVLAAGKPVFIDKPLAGSLADAIAIDELAKRSNTPWFSSSSLRYCTNIPTLRHSEQVGDVLGCDAWGPCSLEPHHPDLFWYGIHGVEILYTIMGPGCESLTRAQTDTAEVVTGTWKDGRIGTFRGIKKGKEDYGAMVFGSKAIVQSGGYDSYKGLVEQIGRFFKTRQVPVAHEETIEIMAFMEAADESKRQGGAPVKIEAVMAKAREQAKVQLR
jgi:predicted dehydrogenase